MRFFTSVLFVLSLVSAFYGGASAQGLEEDIVISGSVLANLLRNQGSQTDAALNLGVTVTVGDADNSLLAHKHEKRVNQLSEPNPLPTAVVTLNLENDPLRGNILAQNYQFRALSVEVNGVAVTSGTPFTFWGDDSDLPSDVTPDVLLHTGFYLSAFPTLLGPATVPPAIANTDPSFWFFGGGGGSLAHSFPSFFPNQDPTADEEPFRFLKIGLPTADPNQVSAFDLRINVNVNPALTRGDPQFNGLQGQSFQFHGMADEVFSLVSSPELQMNSLFKFISSGSCTYNNTVCWSHPGTYLGQIGIQFGADNKILLQSGSHSDGMQVFLNDKPVTVSKHVHRLRNAANSTAIFQFEQADTFELYTDLMYMRIVNSDYFFNLDFGLKDRSILSSGSKQLAINGEICERESRLPKQQLVASKAVITKKLQETYPSYPLHGLVGQTWRNAVYCGRYYEGTVDDYVTGGLFANEHTFNFFNKVNHA